MVSNVKSQCQVGVFFTLNMEDQKVDVSVNTSPLLLEKGSAEYNELPKEQQDLQDYAGYILKNVAEQLVAEACDE